MNYTYETFDKNDEANNDWYEIPLYYLTHWCMKHYKVHYGIWLKERQSKKMMILNSSRKELLKMLQEQNRAHGMSKSKKAELQLKLLEDDDKHWELCKDKARIIAPVNLELVRLKYDIDEEITDEKPEEILS